MNENKSPQIKKAIAKINLSKIVNHQQEYPKSKTLKEIIRYSRITQEANDEKVVFKMGVKLAYNLDTICDPNKAGYVKSEEEKKYWLELSKELFENTIGVKDK